MKKLRQSLLYDVSDKASINKDPTSFSYHFSSILLNDRIALEASQKVSGIHLSSGESETNMKKSKRRSKEMCVKCHSVSSEPTTLHPVTIYEVRMKAAMQWLITTFTHAIEVRYLVYMHR